MTKVVSWNVNGIRSVYKKGFQDWLDQVPFDIVCLQEVRADIEQIPELIRTHERWKHAWFAAEKKGYSGVGILSQETPISWKKGLGIAEFDQEGRVLTAEYPKYFVVTGYFPNSQDKGARLPYKLKFLEALHRYVTKLSETQKLVILNGDFNIAHKPIDLARPKDNEDSPGYLPEERAWMTQFLNSGWVDSFRHLHPEKTEAYSWWSARTFARDRNIGWRIDYQVVQKPFAHCIQSAEIHDQVMGSDHCPVSVAIKI